MNVVPIEDEHARVQSLLPWYATGRLDAADRAGLEAHLSGCARCRAELAQERALQAAAMSLPAPEATKDVETGLGAVRARIAAAAPQPARRPPRTRPRPLAWWHWALGAQFAAIALLVAGFVVSVAPGAPYRGLGGNAGSARADAVLMFRPDATEAQMSAALRAVDARLVGGPTATHAYLVALPVADGDALARLRRHPAVTLAESLASGAPR